MLITLEGSEGVGKTTQRDLVAKCLSDMGLEVVRTREPGGTPLAEKFRDILLGTHDETISTNCETLLFYAAREQHLNEVIRPALEEGKLVICDRFADTTEAYQMAGGKLDQVFLSNLRKHIVGDTEPNLTFVFVMEVEKAFARAEERGTLNRMEGKGLAYYKAAQEHFVKLAHTPNPNTTYIIIDADQERDVITEQIVKEIEQVMILTKRITGVL